MKKIISLLSVVAMMLTMVVNVAFADENNRIYWEEVSKEGNIVTLQLVVETDQNLASMSGSIDIADAVAKGLVATKGREIDATVWNVDGTRSYVVSFSYTNVNTATGKLVMGEAIFDLTNLSEDVTLPIKKAFKATNGNKESIIGDFTNEMVGLTLLKPEEEEEDPKIVTAEADGMNIAINNKVDTIPTGEALKGVRVKVTYNNDAENAKTFGASLYDTLKDVEGGNVAVIFGVAYEGDLTASLFSFEVIQ